MCGLFASSKKLNTSEISKILKRLDSRGPDDTKVRSNSMGTYIFSRLEITGRDTTYMQPLEKTNSDKKDFFLFNGEIYNYKEIKKKFKLSYKNEFSDTRVLSYLLDKFPFQKAIKHLNGMYAIAKINDNFKEVILSRDTFGQKPLYYSLYKNNWYISSDPYAIAIATESKLDNNQLKNFLFSNEDFGTRGLNTGETYFKNIKEVPANSIIKINKSRVLYKKIFNDKIKIKKIKYKKKKSEKKIISELKNNIEKVVKNYCSNHKDVAFTFSGGIDSTILLLASLKLKKNFKYYTKIADGIDEIANDSVKLLKKIGIKRYERIKINQKNYLSDLIEFIIYSAAPARWGTAPSMMPIYKKMFFDKMKICIGGDGADELFYGYPNINKLNNDLKKVKKLSYLDVIKKYSLSGWNNRSEKSLKNYKKEILKNISVFIKNNKSTKNKKFNFLAKLIQNLDLYFFLPKIVMPHSDLCSMNSSIELRSPFLDNNIVNNALDFNTQEITLNKPIFLSKYILKKVLEKQCEELKIKTNKIINEKHGTRNFAIQTARKININKIPKDFFNFLKLKKNREYSLKYKYKLLCLAIFFLHFHRNYSKSKILNILN